MKRRRMKHYLGIDPGKNGGLCVISAGGTPLLCDRMPQGTSRIADWISSASQQCQHLVMVTEKAQAMPKQGIASAFRYGVHYGIFEAIAAMLKVTYIEVSPSVWKKGMAVTSNKAESIKQCRRIFPGVELVPSGCRVEHDGMAEALLVAEWARRKRL